MEITPDEAARLGKELIRLARIGGWIDPDGIYRLERCIMHWLNEELEIAAIEDVQAELKRAATKFPTWPTDPIHALAVLGEEYGELTKAILQHTYEPHKSTLDDVRNEAVQTAAMAIRLLMSLEVYEYRKCNQHSQ
ncbi:MAG: hypothetical protein IPK73_30025 [Candidatus Obscuribacter sp.]|nr:hypothetical protein [Candidatus Obscuribacter sp.]